MSKTFLRDLKLVNMFYLLNLFWVLLCSPPFLIDYYPDKFSAIVFIFLADNCVSRYLCCYAYHHHKVCMQTTQPLKGFMIRRWELCLVLLAGWQCYGNEALYMKILRVLCFGLGYVQNVEVSITQNGIHY